MKTITYILHLDFFYDIRIYQYILKFEHNFILFVKTILDSPLYEILDS